MLRDLKPDAASASIPAPPYAILSTERCTSIPQAASIRQSQYVAVYHPMIHSQYGALDHHARHSQCQAQYQNLCYPHTPRPLGLLRKFRRPEGRDIGAQRHVTLGVGALAVLEGGDGVL